VHFPPLALICLRTLRLDCSSSVFFAPHQGRRTGSFIRVRNALLELRIVKITLNDILLVQGDESTFPASLLLVD
jgi:hypothetical protein